jgi:hypothetical protein
LRRKNTPSFSLPVKHFEIPFHTGHLQNSDYAPACLTEDDAAAETVMKMPQEYYRTRDQVLLRMLSGQVNVRTN